MTQQYVNALPFEVILWWEQSELRACTEVSAKNEGLEYDKGSQHAGRMACDPAEMCSECQVTIKLWI
jgi:hypothetical protein